jgi:hypothetical protein
MVLIYNIPHRKIFFKTWIIEYLGNILNNSIRKLEINITNASDIMPLFANWT